MAAFPTGVIYLINEVWEKDLHKWNWMPLVGYYNCELRDIGPSSFIYLIGPMLILTILIVIMFVLTVIGIYKVKRELKKLNQDEEMTIQCFSFDTETYLMVFRLFVVMGAIWILQISSFFNYNSFFKLVHNFALYSGSSLGIIVFMVLIPRRSTLKLLMESCIRERRQ
ncbi:probable G-protein coupled receptor Mth-like 7 [Drosophila takahashii]|uniref:probable G-protein coupled receptor Mth-like 7 n=1 Tax=Drosophila takahashii TaxID=29030 RepID=UPI0038996C29